MTTTVMICVSTYRRPTDIVRCLASLKAERAAFVDKRADYDVSILIVDNDAAESARPVVAGELNEFTALLTEPKPGIAAARNRALVAAENADLVIFVDDDEVVSEGWLARMVGTWEDFGRPVAVAGRVVSHFDRPLDPWIAAGGFFRRRTLPTGSPITVAATNNLLLDMATLRRNRLRFDDYYGLIGGSDTDLTRRIVKAGGAMVWCDEAVVVDHVPADRATRDWVLARARRTGNSGVVVELRLADTAGRRLQVRANALATGLYRMLIGTAAALVGSATGSLPLAARGAKARSRGRGMVMGATGSVVSEYSRPSEGASGDSHLLRVLTSFPEPRPTTNPYIVQLAEALAATTGVELTYYSPRQALFGRYDVVHLHWPETAMLATNPIKRVAKTVVFAAIVTRWRVSRTPVVRTVHNTRPHERQPSAARVLLAQLDRLVVRSIALNPADHRTLPGSDLILHGDYRRFYRDYEVPAALPGRLLFAGLIRPYKNVVELIETFALMTDTQARLVVAGASSSPELSEAIASAARADDRVTVRSGFLSHVELAREIGLAQLVVLPYSEMGNSGAALLALSLDRPVLVPDNEVNRELAAEVGEDWVLRYTGPLDAGDLAQGLKAASALAGARGPQLSARGWDQAGPAHLRTYTEALALRGRRSHRAGPAR